MYWNKTRRSDTRSKTNNNRCVLRGYSGFSLLEVIIALGILGIVLLPFLGFVSYRLSQERQGDDLIRAVELAKSKMEQVMALVDITDCEEVVDEKFLVKIKVLDGDKHDEPRDILPLEIRIGVFRIEDGVKLIELHGLK